MGHAIDILKVKNKNQILSAAEKFAYLNVDRQENYDGSYHGNLSVDESKLFNSFEEAQEYLEKFFGWYDDKAVRFKEPTKIAEKTKTQIKMESKAGDLRGKIRKLQVDNRKSKTVTCKCCGTRVEIKEISDYNDRILKFTEHTDFISKCPKCKADLRNESQLEKEEKLLKDFNDLKEKIKILDKKRIKKTEIMWAVKVEVHC